MWTNGYNTYGNALQRDAQPSNWLNQNISNGISSKSLAIAVEAPRILDCPDDKSNQFFKYFHIEKKNFQR
jgi:hypothetical protein